jgi:DNA-binding NarL/FixJ family response regulator
MGDDHQFRHGRFNGPKRIALATEVPANPEGSPVLVRFLSVSAIAASEETALAAVGVAAEDPRVRTRLAGALAAEPGLCVRAGASPRRLISTGDADDLLVLHLSAIDAGELALIADLRREAPELPIIAVSDSTDHRSARRVVDCGVDGFVFAKQLGSALAPTVAAVLAGQIVLPKELRPDLRAPTLSVREKQILGMVVMGFTNCEIASRLFVAESTVKSHLSAAFRKLGVRSRSEAASLILDPHGSLGPGILAITPAD